MKVAFSDLSITNQNENQAQQFLRNIRQTMFYSEASFSDLPCGGQLSKTNVYSLEFPSKKAEFVDRIWGSCAQLRLWAILIFCIEWLLWHKAKAILKQMFSLSRESIFFVISNGWLKTMKVWLSKSSNGNHLIHYQKNFSRLNN